MGSANRHGRTLRATLCEVERGVFYATYPDCGSASGADELTRYQTGTCAADAKQRIERTASALGYDGVVWTETIKVPLFASHTETAAHRTPETYAVRHEA
jgi:hypothetical protein